MTIFISSIGKLGLITIISSLIMLLVQLILISSKSGIEPFQLDQFYMGLQILGLVTIPITTVIQTYHSSSLGEAQRSNEIDRQTLTLDCLISFFISSFLLTSLFIYIQSLDLKSVFMILLFSLVSTITVLGCQYNLFKKSYLISQMSPLLLSLMLLAMALLAQPLSVTYILLYAAVANMFVMLSFGKKNYIVFKETLFLIRWFDFTKTEFLNSLERLLSVILQVGPAFYIVIISSVLVNNFQGYASLFGFYYSLIGVFSVFLGQNLLSVLLAEKTFNSLRADRLNLSSIFKVTIVFIITVIILELGRRCLIFSLVFFKNYYIGLQYLEFLILFYYPIIGSLLTFILWNILRAYFIHIVSPGFLAGASALGFIIVTVSCYFALLTNDPAIAIYALPSGLLTVILFLISQMVLKKLHI